MGSTKPQKRRYAKKRTLTAEERAWLERGDKLKSEHPRKKNVWKGSDQAKRVTSVASGGLPTLGKRR